MRRLVWVLGVLLVAAGLVGLVLQGDPPAGDYGWFAYTPLDGNPGPSGGGGEILLLTRGRVVAAAAVAVGLLVLAGAVGHRLGRRTTAPAVG